MRQLLLLCSIFLSSPFLKAQTASSAAGLLQPTETIHEFGKIPQGKPVSYQFVVSNPTKDTLSIQHIQASCGCTTPEFSKDPILPGTTAVIKVGYNAMAEGPFQKSLTVFLTNNQHQELYIKGQVWKTPDTSVPLNKAIQLIKQ